jgi:hypothetical protein
MVVTRPHPFSPVGLGTMCFIPGCWGWVDDPRHLFHPRAVKPETSYIVTWDARGRVRTCPKGRRGRLRA